MSRPAPSLPLFGNDKPPVAMTTVVADTSPWFVTPGMGVLPKDAPDAPETVTVRFEKGRPVAINGKATTAFQAIQAANAIGGKHAVGIATHHVYHTSPVALPAKKTCAPGFVAGQCFCKYRATARNHPHSGLFCSLFYKYFIEAGLGWWKKYAVRIIFNSFYTSIYAD